MYILDLHDHEITGLVSVLCIGDFFPGFDIVLRSSCSVVHWSGLRVLCLRSLMLKHSQMRLSLRWRPPRVALAIDSSLEGILIFTACVMLWSTVSQF